jgi:Fe-S cluster assembly iron-binding protein IscA
MGSAIRLFTAAGCCGPSIQMDLVKQGSPGDIAISMNEVDFYIESQAEQMLEEVTIDFKENGFRIEGLKKSGGCC